MAGASGINGSCTSSFQDGGIFAESLALVPARLVLAGNFQDARHSPVVLPANFHHIQRHNTAFLRYCSN